MDNNTYRKILSLIIIANLLFFGLYNANYIFLFLGNILSLFIPLIIGICIAFVLNIPMTYFEKLMKKYSKKNSSNRILAIFISIFLFIIVIYIIISMIVPEVINSINEIRLNLPGAIENIQNYIAKQNGPINDIIPKMNIDLSNSIKTIMALEKGMPIFNPSTTLQSIFSVTTSIFSGVFSFFLGLIFSIYILADKENLILQTKRFIKALFGEEKSIKIIGFIKIVSSSFSKFIEGQGTEALILGILFLISMTILSIPKAVPISAIIAVFSLVPIFGTTIACIFGMLVILIVSPIKSLWFLILFLVLQQIEGNLIYPKVVGKSVGLPSIWVLLAITVIGSYGGLVGFIVAVPTMSVIYTLVTDFIDKKNNL